MWHGAWLGWTPLSRRNWSGTRTYHIADCVALRDDAYLAWTSSSGCDAMRAAVRAGVDQWQLHAPLIFTEVDNATYAWMRIRIGPTKDHVLGVAMPHTGEVVLDENACWYADRAFCHSVYHYRVAWHFLLGCLWALSILLGLWLACGRVRIYRTATRIAVWTLVVACPITYLASVRGCMDCHDLTATVVHETGHLLGLGHSDDTPGFLGCTQTVTNSTPTESMMHSRAQSRPSACLAPDDVDGVRFLYHGDCTAPLACYETAVHAGYARVASAILYGFVAALFIVAARDALARYQFARASKRPS